MTGSPGARSIVKWEHPLCGTPLCSTGYRRKSRGGPKSSLGISSFAPHEGKVGNKEKYDPRSYMKLGEAGLAKRVKQAVTELRGVGTTLFGSGR